MNNFNFFVISDGNPIYRLRKLPVCVAFFVIRYKKVVASTNTITGTTKQFCICVTYPQKSRIPSFSFKIIF
jgi:hypothetical protein